MRDQAGANDLTNSHASMSRLSLGSSGGEIPTVLERGEYIYIYTLGYRKYVRQGDDRDIRPRAEWKNVVGHVGTERLYVYYTGHIALLVYMLITQVIEAHVAQTLSIELAGQIVVDRVGPGRLYIFWVLLWIHYTGLIALHYTGRILRTRRTGVQAATHMGVVPLSWRALCSPWKNYR